VAEEYAFAFAQAALGEALQDVGTLWLLFKVWALYKGALIETSASTSPPKSAACIGNCRPSQFALDGYGFPCRLLVPLAA